MTFWDFDWQFVDFKCNCRYDGDSFSLSVDFVFMLIPGLRLISRVWSWTFNGTLIFRLPFDSNWLSQNLIAHGDSLSFSSIRVVQVFWLSVLDLKSFDSIRTYHSINLILIMSYGFSLFFPLLVKMFLRTFIFLMFSILSLIFFRNLPNAFKLDTIFSEVNKWRTKFTNLSWSIWAND